VISRTWAGRGVKGDLGDSKIEDPKTGRSVERIAERLLTENDIKAAPSRIV
jgi:hypothetical protein